MKMITPLLIYFSGQVSKIIISSYRCINAKLGRTKQVIFFINCLFCIYKIKCFIFFDSTSKSKACLLALKAIFYCIAC